MQDILVDIFQPVFRKDEETAWTIVKSKQSTRPAPSTRYSDSVRNVLQHQDVTESVHRRFTFENDLFLAPVYKRLLLRSLSAPDLTEGYTDYSSLQESASVLTRDKDFGKGLDIRIDDASSCALSSSSDDFDLTPKNVVNSLRSAGCFSMGVQVDLAEMRRTTGAFNLPKRSLPLHSALKQSQMEPNEQLQLNSRLIRGAHAEDMSIVAQALDDGADVNAVDEGGVSALDICLNKWHSIPISKEINIAHLLLLYRETAIRSKGKTNTTLLHLAILSGGVALVACLIQDLTDTLRPFLQGGLSPLYIAPAFSYEDLAPFREINRILVSNQINPDTVPGYEGKSALHLAAVEGDTEYGAKLVGLGCNPYAPMEQTSHNNDGEGCYSSAVFLALKLGHTDFVLKVVDVSSTEHMTQPGEVGHDETLKLVRFAEQQGYPQIAEMLLQRWLDWHIEKGVIDNLYSSLVTSDATRDHAALFLMLISQGRLPSSVWLLDITSLVPHILAICDEKWAINVFKGINTAEASGFIYRITRTVAPEATDETVHDLEDLLVQILYACGHSWARSGRRGEVQKPERLVSPPALATTNSDFTHNHKLWVRKQGLLTYR
jgi:ankyrin repeat protein